MKKTIGILGAAVLLLVAVLNTTLISKNNSSELTLASIMDVSNAQAQSWGFPDEYGTEYYQVPYYWYHHIEDAEECEDAGDDFNDGRFRKISCRGTNDWQGAPCVKTPSNENGEFVQCLNRFGF